MSIAKRLETLREALGLSQAEVARRVSVEPARIWKYENGVYTPSLETLIKLARVYGTTVEAIMGTDDAPSSALASSESGEHAASAAPTAEVADDDDEEPPTVPSEPPPHETGCANG